jgi:hypothetical protein
VHLSCAARSSCHVGPSTRYRVPARAMASRQIPRLHAMPRARRPSRGARGWAGSEYSRDTSRGNSREVGETWAPRRACAESGLPLSLCGGAASRRTGPVSGARKKEKQAGQRGACAELRAGLRTGTASSRCPQHTGGRAAPDDEESDPESYIAAQSFGGPGACARPPGILTSRLAPPTLEGAGTASGHTALAASMCPLPRILFAPADQCAGFPFEGCKERGRSPARPNTLQEMHSIRV